MRTLAAAICIYASLLPVIGVPNATGLLLVASEPTEVVARVGEVVEVPLVIDSVTGEPGDGWREVKFALRYDPAVLIYLKTLNGDIPDAVVKAVEGPRAENSPYRRVTVTCTLPEDRLSTGVVAVPQFKVRAAGDAALGSDSLSATTGTGERFETSVAVVDTLRTREALRMDGAIRVRKGGASGQR